MTVRELSEELGLSACTASGGEDRQVSGAYVGDLLSDVIANSRAGQVWITMQVHVNIVAVAVLKELAAIVIVNGRTPAEDTLRKAREEKVPILMADIPAFEVAGKLYGIGIGSEK